MRFTFFLVCFFASLFAAAQQSPYAFIPYPQKVNVRNEHFELNAQVKIHSSNACIQEAQYFIDFLNAASHQSFQLSEEAIDPTKPFIFFSSTEYEDAQKKTEKIDLVLQQSLKKEEGYQLTIDPRAIIIQSQTNAGIFYGIQTLIQTLPASCYSGEMRLPYSIVSMNITDQPRFEHRGMLLDCCRHFMTVDFVKRYIDILASYKMNVFHWHLTEDQGWRIEIKKYPLLTEVGSKRIEENGGIHEGFYTQEQIKEVVAYAAARHITIIPEIEMPGHSSAAIAAYPFLSCTQEKIPVENEWGVFKDIYCAGNDSTFKFLENVLDEVCAIFPGTYIHIGGDEAPKFRWEHCDKCQQRIRTMGLKNEAELQTYFIERMAQYLASKGKKIVGWDEIMEGGIPGDAMIQSWRGMEHGIRAAEQKHRVVMSPTSHCYFDYGLESTDMREVYSFNPAEGITDATQLGYIVGGECNMWTEHAPQFLIDQKMFPRLLAFTEALWTADPHRDYAVFSQRFDQHLPLLEGKKIEYGLPAIPIAFADSIGKNNLTLAILPQYNNITFKYSINPLIHSKIRPFETYEAPLQLQPGNDYHIIVSPYYRGKAIAQTFDYSAQVHAGVFGKIELGFIPSPYYPGESNAALIDGRIGTNDFRDGAWQAVSGQNMEVVIDLQSEQKVSALSTHFFHYANAWIFRPLQVAFYISSDKINWKLVDEIEPLIREDDKRIASTLFYSGPINKSCRYIKMVAFNNGPCPAWHDAPGEPSWLFCDEIIIHP